MKRILRPAVFGMVLAALLSVSAFAMNETKDGQHPLDGEIVSYSSTGEVKVRGNDNEKFSVTASGVTSGEQYLLLVLKEDNGAFSAPTESNIIYIDQAAADGTSITFDNVFPTLMNMNTQYEVHVVGTGKDYNSSKSTFSYDYVTYIRGDADGDRDIYANDAMLILQYSVSIIDDTKLNTAAADVDGDGHVYANDAMLVLQRSVGILDENFARVN